MKNEDVSGLIGCGMLIIIIIISMIINSFTFPYAINTWLTYMGKEASVVWWQGILIGLVPGIGQLGIAIAVFTWILMLFL